MSGDDYVPPLDDLIEEWLPCFVCAPTIELNDFGRELAVPSLSTNATQVEVEDEDEDEDEEEEDIEGDVDTVSEYDDNDQSFPYSTPTLSYSQEGSEKGDVLLADDGEDEEEILMADEEDCEDEEDCFVLVAETEESEVLVAENFMQEEENLVIHEDFEGDNDFGPDDEDHLEEMTSHTNGIIESPTIAYTAGEPPSIT